MTRSAAAPPERVDALVVAAGRGERAGGGVAKQFRTVRGRPLLRWAVEAFAGHARVDRVLAVVAPGQGARAAAALAGLEVRLLDRGGTTRQASVAAGLEAMAPDPPRSVLIHDGARPRPGRAVIGRVLDALSDADGAVPSLPLTDTVKEVDRTGRVRRTLPRTGLRGAQTPQGFRFETVLGAHRAAAGAPAAPDDAALVEAAGGVVRTVPGDAGNLKVTDGDDLDRFARLSDARLPRTGHGCDVHRFGPGDGVRLLGIDIPHDRGLVGHSDADVGLHAVADAILGALGRGDLGQHFPPGDPRWRGADSAALAERVRSMAEEAGAEIVHADVTLVCETPVIAPYRDRLRRSLAGILGIPAGAASVKATTTEGLGFAGRGEGIAAFALATLLAPSARE